MTPAELRRHIRRLNADLPRYCVLEQELREGTGFNNAWYATQKEHWLGWLGEYSGPGAYGRNASKTRTAEFSYNHIQCAPMLFWLAEALEFPTRTLDEAEAAILEAPSVNASQCAAFRRVVPWAHVVAKLEKRTHAIDRLFAKLDRFGTGLLRNDRT